MIYPVGCTDGLRGKGEAQVLRQKPPGILCQSSQKVNQSSRIGVDGEQISKVSPTPCVLHLQGQSLWHLLLLLMEYSIFLKLQANLPLSLK